MHPSFDSNCNRQVIYSKLNLKVEYPPHYEQLVWDYKNADSQGIYKPLKASIRRMHSESKILMSKCISLTELVSICENSIPNKYVTVKFFNVIFFGPDPSHFENLRKKLYHPLPTPTPPISQYHSTSTPAIKHGRVPLQLLCKQGV